MGWIKPKNHLKLLSIILGEAILFAVVSFGPTPPPPPPPPGPAPQPAPEAVVGRVLGCGR